MIFSFNKCCRFASALHCGERHQRASHSKDPSRGRFFVMTAYTFYTFEAHIAAKTLVEKLIMVSSFTHRKDTQYALTGENVSPSLLIPDWIIFQGVPIRLFHFHCVLCISISFENMLNLCIFYGYN